MKIIIWLLGVLATASSPVASKHANNNSQPGHKDQYCTDPRTMSKHAAYTEWADAYSCTRHRCQPGGRNLAIYTVGCKRVEAPESAIECEEVVEDTNMQFPFCCTRLRCLVVVRGEVWTRVLGQPWEVLPAAPWSHMYKMKKPPPSDTTFQPKVNEQGPIYELTESESDNEKTHKKVSRSGRKVATSNPDCNEVVQRAEPPPASAPDIVIALSTNSEKEQLKSSDAASSKHTRKSLLQSKHNMLENEEYREQHEADIQDLEEQPTQTTEKPIDASEEKFRTHGKKIYKNPHQASWTDIPQNQWSEHEGLEAEPKVNEPNQQEIESERKENKIEKPGNFQALVDAIGTRMKDIENVVQKMSEKVRQSKIPVGGNSGEKRYSLRRNKYIHLGEEGITVEPSIPDENGNYFSDASNAVRRANVHQPKEPAVSQPTYMAPVEPHHKPVHIAMASDTTDVQEIKKKKHNHKRKKNKTHAHKKHRNQEKRKHFNKFSSVEVDKNRVSLEDSSAI